MASWIVSDSGFDWLLLDTEHSPNEIPDLVGQLQAVSHGAATPIVRPAWNDTVLIKRCLDIGAQALLVPYVQNAEEAKRAVVSDGTQKAVSYIASGSNSRVRRNSPKPMPESFSTR